MRIQDCQMDISCQRTASETRESSYVFRVERDEEFKNMMKSYANDRKIVAQEVEPRASAIALVPESWSSGAITVALDLKITSSPDATGAAGGAAAPQEQGLRGLQLPDSIVGAAP